MALSSVRRLFELGGDGTTTGLDRAYGRGLAQAGLLQDRSQVGRVAQRPLEVKISGNHCIRKIDPAAK